MQVIGLKMVGEAEGHEDFSPKHCLLKMSTELGVLPG